MQILDSLAWRYATKKFDANRFLTTEQVDTLKEAFNLTATSYGLQPLRLVVINNKELQEQLVPHSWNQRQVADASHVLVLCIENTIDTAYIESYFDRVKTIRNTPDEIIAPFKEFMINSFKDKTQEDLDTWAAKQAYIAMGNLLTVCGVERIDACPMEGFVPEKYDEVLGLEAHGISSVLVLPVGYRAEDDMFADFKKVRKTIAESILEL
ncbi:NAD(P)H-dependent oxidoreductase [Kordia sp. YSTF-M3]|uniref:NAD(P)H-dependent oxidoreductase n=1 Tax=Kordia aestuariivivens TaxID=2759037 RepID=A0ABR7QF57_9FLAO|nr:NAD(P)H-dependent oxidoreductase [Kordia aestuariivivens]MBC8757212.1 NAD(P)H-dependent oxidoreductase [Kordia aestuariivivens]